MSWYTDHIKDFFSVVLKTNLYMFKYPVRFLLFKTAKNQLQTLAYQALVIHSEAGLNLEIEFIKMVLSKNGYPLDIVDSSIWGKNDIHKPRLIGPQKCFVCM